MKRVSILIPIYNRLSITIEGLTKLNDALIYYNEKGHNNCHFSVIVIDDGSTDGSSEWISQNFSSIHLVLGDGNLWWTGAINKGVRYSIDKLSPDFLLLWNDDVFPRYDYFIQLDHSIKNISQNVIIGSLIMFKNNPTKVWSAGGTFNELNGRINMHKNYESGKKEIECDWLPGMGTLIPQEIITKQNIWWDEKRFPQYHGDSDSTLKCKKAGIKVITNLSLVLFNNTDSSGLQHKRSLKKLLQSLTSIRSDYNIYRNFLFYSRHGIIPFVYWGMLKKYFFYIGGFFLHLPFAKVLFNKSNSEQV